MDLPLAPGTLAKPREGLFVSKYSIYICIVLAVALASYGGWLHTRSIFACPARGYTSDRYLASCNGGNYSDYEHGAFWFALEPGALAAAAKADVLFLGNSRLQVAFSAPATADWFSAASARHYLMGFGFFENVLFEGELLRRIQPRASVYVINLDDFFAHSESLPMNTILHDPMSRSNYEGKQLWQRLHESVCKRLPVLCGSKYVIFRSRETGTYFTEGTTGGNNTPVSYDQTVDPSVVERNVAGAIDFLREFTQGKCVILTLVPFSGTNIGDAKAIAAALGEKLVAPDNLEGLQTHDGYHLDQQSAQRWSEAFVEAAGPEIRSCIEKHGAAGS
ncbi:MAG TPA: hypothetical protein VGF57_07030 [Roseiarcus sp.]